jgi:hypothetical protein
MESRQRRWRWRHRSWWQRAWERLDGGRWEAVALVAFMGYLTLHIIAALAAGRI